MSTTIVGIIKHQVVFPPSRDLPDEMNATIKSQNPFLQGPWSWNFDVINNNEGWALQRPNSTEIWLGPKAALLHPGISWGLVCTDKPLRRNLLSAMFEEARFFKSPGLILLSIDEDPWYSITKTYANGTSFEEILQRLAMVKEPYKVLWEAVTEDGSIDGYIKVEEPFEDSLLMQ